MPIGTKATRLAVVAGWGLGIVQIAYLLTRQQIDQVLKVMLAVVLLMASIAFVGNLAMLLRARR